MKKILSIISTISITTITTNIIACNTPNTSNKPNKPIEPQFIPQQPPINSNWKHVLRTQSPNKEFLTATNKWYFYVRKYGDKYITKKIYFNNDFMNNKNTNTHWQHLKNDSDFIWDCNSIYRWDGDGEPQTPTIDKNTGKITSWQVGNELSFLNNIVWWISERKYSRLTR